MKEDRLLQDLEPETYPDRRIRLILDNQGSKHSLTLHMWMLIAIVIIIIAGVTLLGVFAFRGDGGANTDKVRKLETENRYLRGKIDKFETVIDSIEVRLDSLNIAESNGTKVYPYYSGGAADGKNLLQVNPGLVTALDSVEMKLNGIKQLLGLNAPLQSSQLNFPAGFEAHGDGIPSIYPTFGSFTSTFGTRLGPFTGDTEFHRGMDIANRVGTPVYATADGIVSETDSEEGYGKVIVISHVDGYQTLYGHLYGFKIRMGDAVHKGQIIGLMGNTGMSTGPHLHYTVMRNGAPVDPSIYLNRIDSDSFSRV